MNDAVKTEDEIDIEIEGKIYSFLFKFKCSKFFKDGMTPHDIAMLLKYQFEQNHIDEKLFAEKVLNNKNERTFQNLMNEKRNWNEMSIFTRNSFKKIYLWIKNPDKSEKYNGLL